MKTDVATMDPQDERRRRTLWLAWAHALLAIGFLVAFVWVQSHK